MLSTIICANAKVKWIGQLCVSFSTSLIYFAFTTRFFFSDYCYANIIFQFFFQYSNYYFDLGSKAGRLLVQKHSFEQTNVTSLNNLQVQCSFYNLHAPKKKEDWLILGKIKKNSEMPIPRNLKTFEFWISFSWTRMNFLNIKCSLCQQKYINNNQNL